MFLWMSPAMTFSFDRTASRHRSRRWAKLMLNSAVVALVVPTLGAPALAQISAPSSLTNNSTLLRKTDVDKINDKFTRPELPLTSTEPEVPVMLDQTKAPENAQAIRFAFKGFKLDEPRPIAQANLDEIAMPLSGQTVTLLQVFE